MIRKIKESSDYNTNICECDYVVAETRWEEWICVYEFWERKRSWEVKY